MARRGLAGQNAFKSLGKLLEGSGCGVRRDVSAMSHHTRKRSLIELGRICKEASFSFLTATRHDDDADDDDIDDDDPTLHLRPLPELRLPPLPPPFLRPLVSRLWPREPALPLSSAPLNLRRPLPSSRFLASPAEPRKALTTTPHPPFH